MSSLSRPTLRHLGLALVLAASTSVIGWRLGLRVIFNGTASLPRGFYWITDTRAIHRSDLVAFEIPNQVRRLVVDRHYLPPGAVLVKHVAAVAGDVVCARAEGFTINGGPTMPTLHEDSVGRPLPFYVGCGPLESGEFFVTSGAARSFDSRNFGPITRENIRGVVKPIWTF